MITPYDIIKTHIANGGYKLEEMRSKITQMFLLRELDETQMYELLAMAASNASVDAERPELIKLIDALAENIAKLESRIAALESNSEAGSEDSGEENNGEQAEYPEWKPWDGISKDYTKGAIVSYNGELWVSVFDGQNVWQPGVIGTESLWQRVE